MRAKLEGSESPPLFIDFDAWLYQGFDDSKAALMEVVADTLLKAAKDDKKLIAKIKRNDLSVNSRSDDVLAARHAVAKYGSADARALDNWVAKSGSLPTDPVNRSLTVDAVGRGLAELNDLFGTIQWR